MEDKNEQVVDFYEGAMSLYNTIDIEFNNKENTYTNAEDKIKEILGDEEAMYIQTDDELAGMLFQYTNLGYAVTGVKYLDMLLNNKNIAAMALGYALEVLNRNTEQLIKYKDKYGELENTNNNKIEEKELKGISEN